MDVVDSRELLVDIEDLSEVVDVGIGRELVLRAEEDELVESSEVLEEACDDLELVAGRELVVRGLETLEVEIGEDEETSSPELVEGIEEGFGEAVDSVLRLALVIVEENVTSTEDDSEANRGYNELRVTWLLLVGSEAELELIVVRLRSDHEAADVALESRLTDSLVDVEAP